MKFEEIVDTYHQPLFNLALRVTGNPEDAEDALQDAFLSIHRDLDRFRGDSSLFTWVYKITLHASLKIKNKNNKYIFDTLDEEISRFSNQIPDEVRQWMADPEMEAYVDELVWEIRVGCLEFMTRRLTEEQRLPYILRHGFEHSYDQISEILEIPVSAVKARLNRAIESLRKYYFDQCNWFGNKQKCSCKRKIGFAINYDPLVIERIKQRLRETPSDPEYLALRKKQYPELERIYSYISQVDHDSHALKKNIA